MSKESSNSNASEHARPSLNKPEQSLTSSTKMFILPPNILKNIHLDNPKLRNTKAGAAPSSEESKQINIKTMDNSNEGILKSQIKHDIAAQESKSKNVAPLILKKRPIPVLKYKRSKITSSNSDSKESTDEVPHEKKPEVILKTVNCTEECEEFQVSVTKNNESDNAVKCIVKNQKKRQNAMDKKIKIDKKVGKPSLSNDKNSAEEEQTTSGSASKLHGTVEIKEIPVKTDTFNNDKRRTREKSASYLEVNSLTGNLSNLEDKSSRKTNQTAKPQLHGIAVSTLGTSKRIRKQKKFDDYIVLESSSKSKLVKEMKEIEKGESPNEIKSPAKKSLGNVPVDEGTVNEDGQSKETTGRKSLGKNKNYTTLDIKIVSCVSLATVEKASKKAHMNNKNVNGEALVGDTCEKVGTVQGKDMSSPTNTLPTDSGYSLPLKSTTEHSTDIKLKTNVHRERKTNSNHILNFVGTEVEDFEELHSVKANVKDEHGKQKSTNASSCKDEYQKNVTMPTTTSTPIDKVIERTKHFAANSLMSTPTMKVPRRRSRPRKNQPVVEEHQHISSVSSETQGLPCEAKSAAKNTTHGNKSYNSTDINSGNAMNNDKRANTADAEEIQVSCISLVAVEEASTTDILPANTGHTLPLKSATEHSIDNNLKTSASKDSEMSSDHISNFEKLHSVKTNVENENEEQKYTNASGYKHERQENCNIPMPAITSTLIDIDIKEAKHYAANTLTSTPIVKVPRKRGRPRKVQPAQEDQHTFNVSSTTQAVINDTEPIASNTRHVNKTYSNTNIDLGDEIDNDKEASTEDAEEVPVRRKRGRPPGSVDGYKTGGRGRRRGRGGATRVSIDAEYVPKGSSTFKEGQEELRNGSCRLVECFKCNEEMLKTNWMYHNLSRHNNTSWMKGEEPMDFENDEKLLKKILSMAIKKRRGQLICEQCKIIKRSVNGFLSHMQFCGKSETERKALMITCPICGAVMMPSSREVHERFHKQLEKRELKALQETCTDEDSKLKRRAAEKAITKILEFTEQDAKEDIPDVKKIKLDSSIKGMIKTPEEKKKIPGVWKGIWKRELNSTGKMSCRHIGCSYTSSSNDEMCQHYFDCSFFPKENFVCKICKFTANSNDEVTKHVLEQHGIKHDKNDKNYEAENDVESSDEGDSNTKATKSNEKPIEKVTIQEMKFLEKEVSCPKWKRPYVPAIRWTIEFEQKHYVLQLFENYVPNNFTLLESSEVEKYIPKMKVSMRMASESYTPNQQSFPKGSLKREWKCWNRFEGAFDNDVAAFFTGGPVWAIAWLPIPASMCYKKPHQYIAVSTHPTMDKEYAVGKSYSGHNIIQIWDVGHMKNEFGVTKSAPSFAYAVAHNYGTVWCLEWCPSGCYQHGYLNNYEVKSETKHLRRMGLLAAACSDGNVHIYSLPFPTEINCDSMQEKKLPIYNTDPSITLIVNIVMYDNKEQSWQCTKISWSKESGHDTIAAGFTNGYIALWDLNIKSPLTMQQRKNTTFIQAFRHFYAHGHVVTMVSLIPHAEGRYLASGSIDRSYKIWDLENVDSPQVSQKKGIITDGCWMTHWPCAVVCFDDALSYKHTNSYLIPLREYGYRFYSILPANCPTFSIAISDYGNSIAHGSLAGDIIVSFPHQLMYTRHLEKALQKRKLRSKIHVVDFCEENNEKTTEDKGKKNSEEYSFMPGTYDECEFRFGILFCDKLKEEKEKEVRGDSLHNDKLTTVPIEMYPFTSVNRVSWNPNAWSHLWLASGYQNGLVRLLPFDAMAMTSDLYKLLPRHVEFMRKEKKGRVVSESNR